MKRKSILSVLFVTAIVACLIYIDQTSAQKGNVQTGKNEAQPEIPAVPSAAFTPGNLVVVQVGDGVAAPTNSAAQVALVEYTSGGSLVQTIAIPSGATSPRLTVTGNSTSEAHLVRSSDGNYLTLTGYDVAAGTATGFAAAGTPRTIARVNASGTVDLTTALTDGSTGAVRSAASTNGIDIWQTNSAVGLRYKTFGSNNISTQVTDSPTNTRVVKVFNGNLYMTSGSGGFTCINQIGTGTPTTSGNTTTNLNGMVCSSRSPYSFSISPSGTTLYLADDGAFGSNGGIQKWTLSAGTWTNTYTLLNTGAATTSVRGLTVDWSGSNPNIYATTTASTANNLILVPDTGAASTAITVATAPANTYFRGVDFAPGATVSRVQHVLDFNGDGKTDFAVVRNSGGAAPSQLRWFYNINGSAAPAAAYDFGSNSDILTPADFDGDSKTDIAVWRGDSSPAFYILQSKTNTVRIEPFGLAGDDPTVIADYNGDGSADVAVYRAGVGAGAQSYWFYRTVAGGPTFYVPWGTTGDRPAPGYYDTDAKADFGIVRTEGVNLRWWTLTAAGVTDSSTLFGLSTDKVVTGDFDSDGKTDKAVVRSSGGALTWYGNLSRDGIVQVTFGLTGDTPAVGDYDGDGSTDIAVWRNGLFYVFYTGPNGGPVSYFQLGAAGDRVPASFNVHN